MDKIYIAGAHSRAQTLAVYLKYLNTDLEILAYLYDNDEPNPKSVDGIPVIKINKATNLDVSCPVYLGTRGVNHAQLVDTLSQCGMKDIRPVTVELDLELRNRYLKKYYESVGRNFVKLDDLVMQGLLSKSRLTTCVYVAKSIYDKPLTTAYSLASYEKEIQVGAALTDERIYGGIITDDTGENISHKNKQFCELTALYWIWKNAKEDVVGLCHYRRHFTLPEGWLEALDKEKVDVVLPVPLYVTPNLGDNFRKRHDAKELDYMFEHIKKNYKNDYESLRSFFNKNLYSPCNMFIMKQDVLKEFCEWLFPILYAVVENGGQKDDVYLNRYPGFLSERLMSYYFEKNRNRFKVVYADKNFLS